MGPSGSPWGASSRFLPATQCNDAPFFFFLFRACLAERVKPVAAAENKKSRRHASTKSGTTRLLPFQCNRPRPDHQGGTLTKGGGVQLSKPNSYPLPRFARMVFTVPPMRPGSFGAFGAVCGNKTDWSPHQGLVPPTDRRESLPLPVASI